MDETKMDDYHLPKYRQRDIEGGGSSLPKLTDTAALFTNIKLTIEKSRSFDRR